MYFTIVMVQLLKYVLKWIFTLRKTANHCYFTKMRYRKIYYIDILVHNYIICDKSTCFWNVTIAICLKIKSFIAYLWYYSITVLVHLSEDHDMVWHSVRRPSSVNFVLFKWSTSSQEPVDQFQPNVRRPSNLVGNIVGGWGFSDVFT